MYGSCVLVAYAVSPSSGCTSSLPWPEAVSTFAWMRSASTSKMLSQWITSNSPRPSGCVQNSLRHGTAYAWIGRGPTFTRPTISARSVSITATYEKGSVERSRAA